jgi:hypothetical protein
LNSFTYDNKEYQYIIERKDVKNVNLRVTPKLEIYVSANDNISDEEIHSFVRSKARWIVKNLKVYKESQGSSVQKEFVSGESVRYLGKQYMLKVRQSDTNEVKFYRGRIYMDMVDRDDFNLKEKIFEDWLDERAEVVFKEVVDKVYESISMYDIPYPDVTIKKMKTRWGSSNKELGKINLNRDLIKAPKRSIEYVVLHELVHFLHPGHTDDFYNLIGTIMPDYEDRKKVLDEKIVREID